MPVKKHCTIVLGVLLLLSAGVPSWSATSMSRQNRLDDALVQAIREYDTPAALAALQAGADPNHAYDSSGKSIFWLEWYRIHISRYTADETPFGNTALTYLFSPRSAPNGDGFPFAPGENLVLLKALLQHGANVNPRRSGRSSPLLMAAGYGYSESIRLLIQHGAEVNVQDENLGMTPLQWCVLRDKPDMVQLLLEHHADIHHKDKMGNTALAWASAYKRVQCIEALRQAGAKE